MSETTTCSDCERCTWNPGPDCGRPEHDHCPACGHCGGRHSIRTWLENTADRLVRDATTPVMLPTGVHALNHEMRIEVDAPIDPVRVPPRRPLIFVAELENGNTIETVR